MGLPAQQSTWDIGRRHSKSLSVTRPTVRDLQGFFLALPTFRVVYCNGKPMKTDVYCLNRKQLEN